MIADVISSIEWYFPSTATPSLHILRLLSDITDLTAAPLAAAARVTQIQLQDHNTADRESAPTAETEKRRKWWSCE